MKRIIFFISLCCIFLMAIPAMAKDFGTLRKATVMLNIRMEPSSRGKHVKTLYPGDVIKVGTPTKGWAMIYATDQTIEGVKGAVGYSFVKYLVPATDKDITLAKQQGKFFTKARLAAKPEKKPVAKKTPAKKVESPKAAPPKEDVKKSSVKKVAPKKTVKEQAPAPVKKAEVAQKAVDPKPVAKKAETSQKQPPKKTITLSQDKPVAKKTAPVEAVAKPVAKAAPKPAQKPVPVKVTEAKPAVSKTPVKVAPKAVVQKQSASKTVAPVGEKPKKIDRNKVPVRITADKMTYNEAKGTVAFLGNVKADHAGLIMTSDALTAYLSKKNTANTSNKKTGEIERIEATGDVKMRNDQDTSGSCGRLIYFVPESIISMRENPILMQKENKVQGKEIRFYVNESRSEVISGGGKQVEAVFFAPNALGSK
ncbi:MAG: LptA/OstA family protein [Desulfovibrio sp.]